MHDFARRMAVSILAAAFLAFAYPANADITRLSGPTTVTTQSGLLVKLDAEFDTVNRVYLVGWGTQVEGPAQAMFLDEFGNPLGSPFGISDTWAGWVRIAYSPTHQKFAVAYTKIMGGRHQRAVRFVAWSAQGPVVAPAEAIVDDYHGHAGDASGIAYSAASGKFIVTWWNWTGALPQSYAGIIDGATGAYAGVKHVVTHPADGQSDPEIACDPGSRRCLIVGFAWSNLTGVNSVWGRFVSDSTAEPIGAPFFVDSAPIEVNATVAWSASANRFVVGFVRNYSSVWSKTVSPDGTLGAAGLVKASDGVHIDNGGYGRINIRSNTLTNTVLVSMNDWNGFPVAQELDSMGAPIAGAFDRLPAPGIDGNDRTRYTVPVGDSVNGQFLFLDNQKFTTIRRTLYAASGGGGGGTTTTPPPAPPPVSQFVQRERARADFDGDGKYDLLWQDLASGYLAAWRLDGKNLIDSVLLNFGSGAPARLTDTNWRIIGAGDFNGDGKPDIVWQHQTEGWIGVWFMDGLTEIGGNYFSYPRELDLDWKIVGVGDFNGDGKPDIVWQHMTQRWLAAWLMDGLTVVASELLVPNRINDARWQIAAVADMDGDGKPDLIWRHSDTGDMAYWTMDGLAMTGSYGFTLTQPDPANWKIAAIIDANGDEKPDIVWHHIGLGFIEVWYMNGGTFLGWDWVGTGQVTPTWRVVGPK